MGFGLQPWLEVAVAAAIHTGRVQSSTDEDVENQVPLPGDESTFSTSTWQFGVRAAAAPFPRWVARPVLGAGLAFWRGAGVQGSDAFERMDGPSSTFVELLPGVEASASEHVVPWLRVATWIPVGGTLVREEAASGRITDPPVPEGDPGTGFAVEAGLQVRLGPVVKPRTELRPVPSLGDP